MFHLGGDPISYRRLRGSQISLGGAEPLAPSLTFFPTGQKPRHLTAARLWFAEPYLREIKPQ